MVLEIFKHNKIWGGGQFALASVTPNSGGLVPLDLRPCAPMRVLYCYLADTYSTPEKKLSK